MQSEIAGWTLVQFSNWFSNWDPKDECNSFTSNELDIVIRGVQTCGRFDTNERIKFCALQQLGDKKRKEEAIALKTYLQNPTNFLK